MSLEEMFESLGWKPADPKEDKWGRSVYVNPAHPDDFVRVMRLITDEMNATYEIGEGLTLWSADGREAIQARLEQTRDTGRATTD